MALREKDKFIFSSITEKKVTSEDDGLDLLEEGEGCGSNKTITVLVESSELVYPLYKKAHKQCTTIT